MDKAEPIKVEPEVIDSYTLQEYRNSNQNLTLNSAEALITKAIEHNVNVESMEKILAIRKELMLESARKDFDISMARFQHECPVIKKEKEVRNKEGQLVYKYAPIEAIVKQVKPLLHKHGFSFLLDTRINIQHETATGVCVVKHIAGHTERAEVELPFLTQTRMMSKSQVVEGTLTIAKRLAFCNAFGILTADEDTNGEEIQSQRATDKQLEEIRNLLQRTNIPERRLLERCNVELLSQLTEAQAVRVTTYLKTRLPREE